MPVHFKTRTEYKSMYKTMPGFTGEPGGPIAGKSTQKLAHDESVSQNIEPALQRKKKLTFRPDHVFVVNPTLEPALQAKKRVEPSFAKTSPMKIQDRDVPLQTKKRVGRSPTRAKISNEPALQSKKRIEPECIKSTEKSFEGGVVLQSKKRVSSPTTGIQSEPPMQSKKRTEGPQTTLTNGFYDYGPDQDEYALLGNQDKFAHNVKYKLRESLRSREVSPPKQMKLQKKDKENAVPRPAPVVDTEQFRKPPTPLAPRKPKDQSAPVIEEVKQQQAKEVKEQQVREQQIKAIKEQMAKEGIRKQPKVVRSPKQSRDKEVRQSKEKSPEAENLNRREPVKESMKSKRIENMNEFVQTNTDKGVTDSAAEAPAEYALKYKTGISAPRPTKKFSEYQKQFQWKAGIPPSPLLGAEQVVYNNNPQLSPPKKDVIPKVSEYQKQFKPFKLVPVPQEEQEIPKKKSKLQRSKSLEDLSPAEIPAAGSAPVVAPDNKRLTMESDREKPTVKAVPKVPKGKPRVYKSEYLSNFKPPDRFDYLKGAWQGAHPPHVRAQVPEEKTEKPSALTNWFAEVLELRRKAKEYQLRAQGTHFSREHLVQLMARQTDLWDASTASTARSDRTLSALSLESGDSARRNRRSPKVRENFEHSVSSAATMATEDDLTPRAPSDLEEEVPGQRKLAWTRDEEQEVDDNLTTPSTYSEEGGDGKGRTPTPKLRQQIEREGNFRRRHHLDRTTPSVGGAILSSPPQQKKRSGKKKFVSKSVDSISQATLEDNMEDVEIPEKPVHRPLAGQKTYTVDTGFLTTTPTLGLPSRDTHQLRDDAASMDKPLSTQFVDSPKKACTPGGLGAIDEGYGQTYSKPIPEVAHQPHLAWTLDGGMSSVPRRNYDKDDDDILSVSTRSIASSSSLASETLERARKRKDEFWGKGGIATR